MKNKYLIIFIVFLTVFLTFKATQYFSDKQSEEERLELRKLKIQKNSILKKIKEGHYTKIVADTATEKQLKNKIKSLELELDNAVLIAETSLRPKEITKEIDTIYINGDSLKIVDFYPKQEDYFVRYEANLNFKDSTNIGNFSFGKLPISLVITENKDGTFQSDLVAPEFITLQTLNVISKPLEPTKKDNFGYLLGGKVHKNLMEGNTSYEIMGGFRFKKFNLIGSVDTDKEVGIGTLIEF